VKALRAGALRELSGSRSIRVGGPDRLVPFSPRITRGRTSPLRHLFYLALALPTRRPKPDGSRPPSCVVGTAARLRAPRWRVGARLSDHQAARVVGRLRDLRLGAGGRARGRRVEAAICPGWSARGRGPSASSCRAARLRGLRERGGAAGGSFSSVTSTLPEEVQEDLRPLHPTEYRRSTRAVSHRLAVTPYYKVRVTDDRRNDGVCYPKKAQTQGRGGTHKVRPVFSDPNARSRAASEGRYRHRRGR